MSISLPFKPTDKILELGGGNNSLKRQGFNVINVDKNQSEGVDIVRDLENGFSDLGEYDSLVSIYLVEHISWRKIRQFFNDCFKVLKTNGVAVFIVPNTREQIKKLLEKIDWDEGDSEFLFGGQDYSDNSHKTLFDESYITRLLKDAGFSRVEIKPHPDPNARDMIVYAWKVSETDTNDTLNVIQHSVVDGKPVYEEAYFTTEAYTYGGYRDFPVHQVTVQQVLERKPKSVIELGGARGYICKRLSEHGVLATCLDVSNYCYRTRAHDDFILIDLTKAVIPKKDKEYGLAISIAFLEHIPEDKLDFVIKESMRVSERGLHGITFTITPEDIDQTHCFPSGVMITMVDGNEKSIELLQTGDVILGEEGGYITPSIVKETFKRDYNGELIEIETNDGIVLSATPEHPVKQRDDWIPIKFINQCSILISDNYETLGCGRGRLSQGELEEDSSIHDSHHSRSDKEQYFLESRISKTETQEVLVGTGNRVTKGNVEGILQRGCQESSTHKKLGEHPFESKRFRIEEETLCGLFPLLPTPIIWKTEQNVQSSRYSSRLFSRIHRWGRKYRDRYKIWKTSTAYYGRKYKQRCYQLYSRINQWGYSIFNIPTKSEPQGFLQIAYPWIQGDSHSRDVIALSAYKEAERSFSSSIHEGKIRTWSTSSLYRRGERGLLRSEEIKQKRNYTYANPVYNLRTTTNNYFANGVLVHNCLGTIKPREWWVEKFKSIDPNYPVEILDKEDLERIEPINEPIHKYLRDEIKEGEQN